jgi:methyl-accepting chemotaxis protein
MKLSFTNKIIFFVLSALCISAFWSAYQFHHVVEDMKDKASQTLKAETRSLGHQVASQYFERYGDVKSFALNPVLLSADRLKIAETLDAYASSYGIYDLILVLELDGSVVASNHKTPEGRKLPFETVFLPNFKSEKWFQDLLKGEYTKDEKGLMKHTLVTQPKNEEWMERLYGEKRTTNVFGTLVKDSWGRPFRVIANFANASWYESEIRSFHQRMASSGYEGLEVGVIGSNGKALSAFSGKSGFQDREFTAGSFLLKSPEGIMEVTEGKKKESRIASYSLIRDPKFSDSLGWGLVVQLPEDDLLGYVKKDVFRFYSFLAISVIALGVMAFFFGKRMGRRLVHSVDAMSTTLKTSQETGQTLFRASQDLEDASSRQSSAIQESMSALSEMASMISQTATNAKLSQESTQEVGERTIGGRQIMTRMSESMVAIEQANTSLQEISKSIESISQKTSVINDIVFKTQLLSFNASIEAARAGQYGKGFAVVAEEVGNLAQMSGKAAREIEALILDSEKKVSSTLDLIKRRVNEGNLVTDEAVRTFNGISSAIDSIREQVRLIAEACVQQDVGIQQTNKAMEQLDVAARQTLDAAQMTRSSSDELQNSTEELGKISGHLNVFLHGHQFHHAGAEAAGAAVPAMGDLMVDGHPDSVDHEPEFTFDAEPMANHSPAGGSEEVTADDDSFKKIA